MLLKNFNQKLLFTLILFSISALLACDDGPGSSGDTGRLPADPNDWVCQDDTNTRTQDVMQFCSTVNDFGIPAPDDLRSAPSLFDLDEKNIYD